LPARGDDPHRHDPRPRAAPSQLCHGRRDHGVRLVVLGHGYSAGFLTRRLVPQGWHVTGTTRGDPAAMAATGAAPLLWPGEDGPLRAELARADAILISIAPDEAGDPVLR